MQTATVSWLDGMVGSVSAGAVVLFVTANAAFALGVIRTRDRHFVNRWTKPVLVADAVLIAAAVGAPVAAVAVKLAVKGLLAVGALPAQLIHGK